MKVARIVASALAKISRVRQRIETVRQMREISPTSVRSDNFAAQRESGHETQTSAYNFT